MVSIVVPVYKAEKFIEETIGYVLAQTYTEWELILVADGREDSTIPVIEAYLSEHPDDRIRLVLQEENKGAAMARNRGVMEARGRYIAYLDADDVWLPEKLEKELAFMAKKDAAFIFCGYEFADENAKPTGKVVHVPATITYKQALKNTTIFTTTVVFDTEKLEKERIQMPNVKSEDTALWWKLLREGVVAYGLDENLVYYRRSANTLSSNKLEAIKRIWNLYRNVEGLSLVESAYNFCFWALRAVLRRV